MTEHQAKGFFSLSSVVCNKVIPYDVIPEMLGGNTTELLHEFLQSPVIGIDTLYPVCDSVSYRDMAVCIHLDKAYIPAL